MNFYPHHIGDFNNATRHLNRVERAIYRELIEVYYDREAPLPDDMPWIWKKVLANSQAEREIVKLVLKEFFRLEDGLHKHARCDREIASYRSKQELAVRAGRASAESRLNRKRTEAATDAQRTFNGRSTEIQPTINHEPVTKNQEKRQQRSHGSRLPPDWVPSEILKAWAGKERPDLDHDHVLAKFRDHWAAKPGKAGLKLDWDATFRNWVRDEKPGRRVAAASGEVI